MGGSSLFVNVLFLDLCVLRMFDEPVNRNEKALGQSMSERIQRMIL
jgi:hypothetical protein